MTRGGCPFEQKQGVALAAGAVAVLVSNSGPGLDRAESEVGKRSLEWRARGRLERAARLLGVEVPQLAPRITGAGSDSPGETNEQGAGNATDVHRTALLLPPEAGAVGEGPAVVMVPTAAGARLRAAIADARARGVQPVAARHDGVGGGVLEVSGEGGVDVDRDADVERHGLGKGRSEVWVRFRPDGTLVLPWESLTQLLDEHEWPAKGKARTKLYRRLSRSHHPDKSGGDEDRFQLLSYAYRRACHRLEPSACPTFQDDWAQG